MGYKKDENDLNAVCAVCGTPFHKRCGRQVTCSEACSAQRYRDVQNEYNKARYHRDNPNAVYRAGWGKGKRSKYYDDKPIENACLHNSRVVCKGGDCMTCSFNTDITLTREIRSYGF